MATGTGTSVPGMQQLIANEPAVSRNFYVFTDFANIAPERVGFWYLLLSNKTDASPIIFETGVFYRPGVTIQLPDAVAFVEKHIYFWINWDVDGIPWNWYTV